MMITHVFPLRPNVNVSVTLPRDLTKAEAARLRAFIMTLAIPGEEDDGN